MEEAPVQIVSLAHGPCPICIEVLVLVGNEDVRLGWCHMCGVAWDVHPEIDPSREWILDMATLEDVKILDASLAEELPETLWGTEFEVVEDPETAELIRWCFLDQMTPGGLPRFKNTFGGFYGRIPFLLVTLASLMLVSLLLGRLLGSAAGMVFLGWIAWFTFLAGWSRPHILAYRHDGTQVTLSLGAGDWRVFCGPPTSIDVPLADLSLRRRWAAPLSPFARYTVVHGDLTYRLDVGFAEQADVERVFGSARP